MDTKERLRKRILRLIKDFGVKQNFLADRFGIPRSSFHKWLHGETEKIDLKLHDALASYERDFSRLLSGETQRSAAAKHQPDTAGDFPSRHVR